MSPLYPSDGSTTARAMQTRFVEEDKAGASRSPLSALFSQYFDV